MSPAARVSWMLLCLTALAACEPEKQPVADAGTKKDGGFVLVEERSPDAGAPDAGTTGEDAGSAACGDGTRSPGEACDDGNTAAGDGCSATCTLEPGYTCTASGCVTTCGDGTKAGAETCDDGNAQDGDGCSATCTEEPVATCDGGPCAECGDGARSATEPCDDGNTSSGDGCSATCTLEPGFTCTVNDGCLPTCGDGLVVASETCDDQNVRNGDGCSAACELESGYACTGTTCTSVCGDGKIINGAVDPSDNEACDDSNTASGDGCSAACKLETGFACVGEPSVCDTTCGDGVVAGTERCDDQNAVSGDGCDNSCDPEYGYTCTGTPSTCATQCGDGFIAGTEVCDDGNNLPGDGCVACTVSTGFTCSSEPSECETTCGDGELVPSREQCEPGVTTTAYGCADDCTLLGALTLQLPGAPAGSTATVASGNSYSESVTAGPSPVTLTGLAPGTYTVTADTEHVVQGMVDQLVDPPASFQATVSGGLLTEATFEWTVRGGTGNLWMGHGAASQLRGFSNAALLAPGSSPTASLGASGTRFPAVVALQDGTLVFGGEAAGAGALVTFSAASLFTGSSAVPQPAPQPTLALSPGTAPLAALAADRSGEVWAAAGTTVYRFGVPLTTNATALAVTLQDGQAALLQGSVSSLAFTEAGGTEVLWVARSNPASVRGYAQLNGNWTFQGELAFDLDPNWGAAFSHGVVLAVEEDHFTLWAADVMAVSGSNQLRLQSWDIRASTVPERVFLSAGWSAPAGLAAGKEDLAQYAAPLFATDGSGKLLFFSAADLAGNHSSLIPTLWTAPGGSGLAFSPPHP